LHKKNSTEGLNISLKGKPSRERSLYKWSQNYRKDIMKKKSWKTGGKLRSKNFGKLQAFE
jgi:hypothetical protein